MAKALASFHLMLILCLSTPLLTSSREGNQFIYNGFGQVNLHLDGNAKLLPNGLLQITNTSLQVTGHAFYPYPVKFNGSSLSFSTKFVFAMVPESKAAMALHSLFRHPWISGKQLLISIWDYSIFRIMDCQLTMFLQSSLIR